MWSCQCGVWRYQWGVSQPRFYYRPQRSWGKVMFLHVSVILFTGGVCPIACWDTHTPIPPRTRGRHLPPSGPGTTPLRDQRHPIAQCMLGDTGSKRAVHILLECILVRSNSTEEHNISYTSDNLFHVRTLRRKRFPSHFLSKCVFLLYYKI